MITREDWFKIGKIVALIDGGCATCVCMTYEKLQEAFGEEFDSLAIQQGIFESQYGEYLKISMSCFRDKKSGGREL